MAGVPKRDQRGQPGPGLLLGALLGALLALTGGAAAQQTPGDLAAALQQAVRLGDGAAYRALLYPTGTFAVEGPNFAADLERHPQPDALVSLSNPQPSGEGSQAVTADLRLNWTRAQGSPGEQRSAATFPVRLERVGGVWKYAGEAFQAVPAGDLTLLALQVRGLPQASAWVAPLLERAAGQVTAVTGLPRPQHVTVKVYPDRVTLSASVALSMQPVSGWNEPGEAIKIVLPGGEQQERETLRVLAHELTHLAVGQALGAGRDKRVPWWLHEGLADAVARAYWPESAVLARQQRIQDYARADWRPLRELADFTLVPEGEWSHVYAQGLGIVDYLSSQQGRDAPLRLARAFADLDDPDAAARAVGYATFDALERGARQWWQAQAR